MVTKNAKVMKVEVEKSEYKVSKNVIIRDLMHQCSKMFDENGDFKQVFNENAPRFSGCFLGIRNGVKTNPYLYCRCCIMSNPITGECEKGSEQ